MISFIPWERSTLHMVKSFIRKAIVRHSAAINGNAVLHLAVAEYSEPTCLDLVKRLVEAGCSPTTWNTEGKTVFEVAFERD